MPVRYFGDTKCYISALLGSDTLLRVDGGSLRSVETRTAYCDIDLRDVTGHRMSAIRGLDLTLNIRTEPEAYTITRFDEGLASIPIGDKRVRDCSVEELLYSIQNMIGIV